MFLLFLPLLVLYVVGGLFIVVWGAHWAGRRFQSRWAYGGAFILIFASVFGDEIYGYAYWQQLCSTQGGLHVYKRVPVEGFFIEGEVGAGAAREYLKLNQYKPHELYRFVEGKEDGQLYRYTAGTGGEFDIKKEPISKPSSKYAYTEMSIIQYPHYIWSIERFIYGLTDKSLIGIERSFGYKGATIVRALRNVTGANFEGSAEYCGGGTGLLIIQALPPISLSK